MENIELLRLRQNHLVTQARYDLYTLSAMNDTPDKQLIFQRLWETISSIHFISELLANQALRCTTAMSATYPETVSIMGQPSQSMPAQNTRSFTREELATYDGKNGRAAYVAVNDVVYDVTGNRAWAAATHFGLVAGREYTQEFASCHAGQESILAQLPAIGRLV
jgi:membrane-associated progesterone receptor component